MNVNVRQEMLRAPGMPQQPMMGLNGGPFMQSAPHGQPGSQQQPMGLPPNNVPPMGMLSGPPNPGHPMNQQRYQMQMQQQQQQQQQPSVQQRQMMMRPPGQPMNPAAGGSHMGPGFAPNHMMHQQGRRGVSSTSINPGAPPHLAGHMQQMGGMNQQPNMMGQMRQQQPPQSIPGPAMRSVSAGHMSPEMGMAMGRPGGNPGMPQNINRTGSAPMPMMNGINQPSMGQPPSMQVGMSSNHQNYQSPVPMSMQHQQPQLSGSPRPPSHPSSQPPNMNMGPGPSNPGMNRVSMPPSNESPMEFMDFSAQPFSAQGSSNGNNQFAFVPSSTPPTQPMSRSLPPNLGNTPPNRGGFQLTPAQQFAEMQQNADSYSNFAMPPPRPPSHNLHTAPLQQSQPSHAHSPHSGDHMNVYPPRPHSRPQSQPGRPLSSQEPRAVQHIPPNPSLGPGPPQGRLQPQHTGPHPHPPQPGLPPPLSSSVNPPQPSNSARPPNQPPNSNFGHGGSPASSSTMSSSDQQASTSVSRSINPAPSQLSQQHVGQGQGLLRLLQFSGNLSSENKTKLQLSWWTDVINEFFTPKSVMRITLWKDNQRSEAKPFEIGVPILPRFFLVTTQSGVKSMSLTLDGARERMYAANHCVVECVAAVWTYRYKNGYTVTLRGPLTAHVVITSTGPYPPRSSQGYVLRFEDFQFDANYHDKYISVDSIVGRILPAPNQGGPVVESPKTPRSRHTPAPPGSSSGPQNGTSEQEEEDKKWEEPKVSIERGWIPGEPVNAFGIPQATMRCLELAESVAQMSDLIGFATDTHLGAIDALNRFAGDIREKNPHLLGNVGQSLTNGASQMSQSPYYYAPYPTSTMGSTLYSSASSSITNPSVSTPSQQPSTNSPKTTPASTLNSPQKHHKTIPAPQNSAATPTSAVNTPAMASASLKRKQPTDSGSPTTTEVPPATKRTTRRRRTTGTGGG